MKPEILTLALVGLLSGLFGAIAAFRLIQRMLLSELEKAIVQPSFENITLVVEVHELEGRVHVVSKSNATGTSMTATYVQKWLETQGLMMMPAGQDFTVKVKP